MGFQPIKSALARHLGVQVPVISCHEGHHLSCMPINIGTFPGLHGLCFDFCFAGPLPQHSLSHGPLLRINFGESLVVRLYSEIDQIHLSSEAQCVSHHLPQVDCHRLDTFASNAPHDVSDMSCLISYIFLVLSNWGLTRPHDTCNSRISMTP